MTNFARRDIELGIEDRQPPPSTGSWWQRQSIRFKTIVLAIAIGTVPTLLVGSVAYYFAADSIERESSSVRKALVGELQDRVNVFTGDRLNDVRMMAGLPVFTNPKLSKEATKQEKTAVLQQIQDVYGMYNSIAVFNLKGDVIAQTQGQALGNHLNRSYVREALEADRAIISQPLISTSSGIFSIYGAAPIKDSTTGKTIGFVRARIPVAILSNLLQSFTENNSEYYLLDNRGQIFLGSAGEYVVKTNSDGSAAAGRYDFEAIGLDGIFANASTLLSNSELATDVTTNTKTQTQQFLAYAPPENVAGLPQLNWQAVLATDTAIVYAPQRKLRLVFTVGSALVALGVAAIAYSLANRLLRPILWAASAVREIGAGNFAIELTIEGRDEIAQLGGDINCLATQMNNFVRVQTLFTQHSKGIKNIVLELARASTSQEIFAAAIRGSEGVFKAERIVLYEFDSESAVAVAECFASGHSAIESTQLDRTVVAEYLADNVPTVEVINDVARSGLSAAKQKYFKSLGVKSCLIAPVLVDGKLDGLLMVHQSSTLLPWLDEEVEFITQVANQIGLALTRLDLLEQQKVAEFREKSAKEAMQFRALSLLREVDDVSTGNLTIRARVTEDEIGTIADSYNSTIESLQSLVNQTKTAANEVQLNTSSNDEAVQSLAQDTIAQATAITSILYQIEQMETSIESIAERAYQAEKFAQQASNTIAREDLAMNRTVTEIKAVQYTVTETAIKAEKLGESSQEISQAVNLIGRFAAQTHLLALKASIEAARAGEQGKGFAVIADEVRSLATQSAEATAEIETLVNKIQLETSEVVGAMHQGAEQIASGNELVQQTRHSLNQVNQVSSEISKLVSSITLATQQQSATSARLSQTMVGVKTTAEHNSQSATKLSGSIRTLTAIADNLQSNIAKFKT